MCTVKSESDSKFSKYQANLDPVFQFEIKETQILKAKKWSPLSRGFDFYLVPHSEGHAWEPHNPQAYLNFPEIQWVLHNQVWPRSLSLSLSFSEIFCVPVDWRRETWDSETPQSLNVCPHVEVMICQAGSCTSGTRVKSLGVYLEQKALCLFCSYCLPRGQLIFNNLICPIWARWQFSKHYFV